MSRLDKSFSLTSSATKYQLEDGAVGSAETGNQSISETLYLGGGELAGAFSGTDTSSIDIINQEVTRIVRSDGQGNYTSIQAAINDAIAGDIIEIQAANGVSEIFEEILTINAVSGGAGNYITMRGKVGEEIIITSPNSTRTLTISGAISYWKLENIVLGDETQWTPNDPNDPYGYTPVRQMEVFAGVHHMHFKNVTFNGGAGWTNCWIRNDAYVDKDTQSGTYHETIVNTSTHHFFFEACTFQKHGSPMTDQFASDQSDAGDGFVTFADNCAWIDCVWDKGGGHDQLSLFGSYQYFRGCRFDNDGWEEVMDRTPVPGDPLTGARSMVLQSGKSKGLGSAYPAPPNGYIAFRDCEITQPGPSQETGTIHQNSAFKMEASYVSMADCLIYETANHVGKEAVSNLSWSRPNNLTEPAHIQDCRIFHNTFYGGERFGIGDDLGPADLNKCGFGHHFKNNVIQDIQRNRVFSINYRYIEHKWSIPEAPTSLREAYSENWLGVGNGEWYPGAAWTNDNGILDWEVRGNIIQVNESGTNTPTVVTIMVDTVTNYPTVTTNQVIYDIPASHTEGGNNPGSDANLPNYSDNQDEFVSFVNLGARTRAGFQLQPTSPGYGDAVAITTVVGTEASPTTSITIDDPLYFFCSNEYDLDEYVSGESDWIKIGSNDPVQIVTLNYTTGVGTISTAQTWTDGDAIRLVGKDGNAITNAGIGSA
jgi:hypothetical protein